MLDRMMNRNEQVAAVLAAVAAACLLAPRVAAQDAAGTAAIDVGECQASTHAAVWSTLPLAKQAAPSEEYDPTAQQYYEDWALKHILPPFVFTCCAAALLAAFVLWRLIKLCTCVRCIRGPRHRSKAAADILGARAHRWLQLGIALLACGVAAGAGYGFSTIQPELQPAGVSVYEQAKAYVAAGLTTANATVVSIAAAEGGVADIRQRVVDLGLEEAAPGIVARIDAFHDDILAVERGFRSAIADFQRQVLDKMQQLQDDWQPTLDKLDVAKNALLYACYAFIISAALGVALGAALSIPSMASASLLALLVLLLLAWGAVWATTTGLKVGSDGCTVVEDKFMTGLVQAAEEQAAAGDGLLATVGVGDTLALGRYYLYGTGRNASQILADLTGWNVWQLLAEANETVAGLQEVSSALKEADSPIATLPDDLDALAGHIGAVAGNISALEAALSHERFIAVYLSVKEYSCCDVLNWLAGLWLSLLIVGCCGLPLVVAAFVWLGRMDKLEPRGCCHVYRRSDYEQFQEEAPSHAVPELPDKKEGGEADLDGPAAAASAASISLRAKFAAAAAAGTWPRHGGAAGATPRRDGGGADTFRIGTAAVPLGPGGLSPSARRRSAELSELLPDSTPSAPALSARSSLGAPRQPWGQWAAAAASAPPSARGGAASAPGSTLNSARGSLAGVPLTPAEEALMPPEQELLPSRTASDAALAASPLRPAEPAAAGDSSASASDGSALSRAGNALNRLKFMRRGK